MLDCLTRIKDIRPLIDRRYKDGEWRFHRNSAYKQWKGQVVHLGNDDVVGVLFSDGISCIFHGNTDLELVTD
jgi:hypothetical protein